MANGSTSISSSEICSQYECGVYSIPKTTMNHPNVGWRKKVCSIHSFIRTSSLTSDIEFLKTLTYLDSQRRKYQFWFGVYIYKYLSRFGEKTWKIRQNSPLILLIYWKIKKIIRLSLKKPKFHTLTHFNLELIFLLPGLYSLLQNHLFPFQKSYIIRIR